MDVSGAPPTARTAFRLRMMPLDDTRTLKYNTLAYARILQKYNTYATYPRDLMAARPLADLPRCGPVPKLLWADLLLLLFCNALDISVTGEVWHFKFGG